MQVRAVETERRAVVEGDAACCEQQDEQRCGEAEAGMPASQKTQQPQARGDTLEQRVRLPVLTRIAGEEATAEQQTRTAIVQRTMKAQVVRVGELPFLVPAADARAWVVDLAGIEPGRNASVVVEPAGENAVDAQSEFAPGGRDDAGLDLVALDAVVSKSPARASRSGFRAG